MASAWDQLYALQDWALARFRDVSHGFHLTGGTALSRGYYHHRDSDDIYWLCCRDSLGLLDAIEQAGSKAAGIFPPVVARALQRGLEQGVPRIAWRTAPAESESWVYKSRFCATLAGNER